MVANRWAAAAASLTAVAMIFMICADAWAYRISPVRMEIAAEPGSRGVFRLTNTQDRMIAVQATVFEQFQGREPARVSTPDDFIVTPPQMVLEPGQTQTVRVQWIADRDAQSEIAYRIVFEQVPVPLVFEEEERVAGHVDAAYTYETAVYVSPRGAEASLQLQSVEHVETADGASMMRLTIANTGGKRTNVLAPRLSLRDAEGRTVELSEQDLGDLNGGLILADSTISLDLPWPETLTPGAVEGDLQARLGIV
ncbi:MAG: fimbria/pilus periplasmic chaperone [Oceanicaulis sp.]